ncbi:MAG: cysteine--tRNA ligase [Candidatus Eisenbacteria bacterium]|jgi:cysteinyl-tRNA synthetase|nr:cysteine--tRNA ligase [Candidatus Eisenbacteria bacterium]
MGLHVYNVLSRAKEEFQPVVPGRVGMYVCGPTVYDHPHLGHAKTYVSFDVVNRYLRFLGYRVRYVQNITDVGHLLDSGEDRIERGAARDKLEPMEVVEKYTWSYFDDMDALGVHRPDISPRASGHIPEQIEIIERMMAKGHAYVVDGSVYFSVDSYPGYGRLSRRNLEEMQTGARGDPREQKRNQLDFALWKRAEPAHLMQWPSPWGRGYPGWHIECTAMSAKYLGLPYDIHGGGLDNLFPHNESEIAQADAAFGTGYAKYWLLTGSLNVDGVKMSKSLGNFVTIKDALADADAVALRLLVLNGHYRSPLAYTRDALEAARSGARRLALASEKLATFLLSRGVDSDDGTVLNGEPAETRDRCVEAMNDDFNTAQAIGALFDAAHRVNVLLAEPTPPQETLAGFALVLRGLGNQVLGVIPNHGRSLEGLTPHLIGLLLALRTELRTARDFARADRIRDELSAAGITVEDHPDGPRWRISG